MKRARCVVAATMVVGCCSLYTGHSAMADDDVTRFAIKSELPSLNKLERFQVFFDRSLPNADTRREQKAHKEVLPAKAHVSSPFISQLPQLPNGCEITSLTMLLQQAGIDVNKMTLARKMKKVPFVDDGYHGNPNIGFVGNMYHGAPGFAVYHGPVASLAREYLGSRVVDLTGQSWDMVEKQLAGGHAVWVITSVNFYPVPESAWQTWHTAQGDMRITFKEHSVLLTGYDDKHVYFNNPLLSQGNTAVNKQNFIKAWSQLGKQAVSYKSLPVFKRSKDSAKQAALVRNPLATAMQQLYVESNSSSKIER